MLDEWCAAEGLSWEFSPQLARLDDHRVSSVDPAKSHWWRLFSGACESIGLKIQTEIFPAFTDSRFIRQLGIPSFGFSPMDGSPILLHEHNEYLSRDVFLKGIGIYEVLIAELADALPQEAEAVGRARL